MKRFQSEQATMEEMGQTHRGRPRAARQPGERATLSLRITAELFDRLDSAAKQKGRALSNEAEMRLESSFHTQEVIERTLPLAYGNELAAILLTIATVLKQGGPQWQFLSTQKIDGDWLSDPYAFNQASEAINRLLEALRPEGDPSPPSRMLNASEEVAMIARDAGKIWANGALHVIAGVPGALAEYERALAPIKPMLGPIASHVRNFLTRKGWKLNRDKEASPQ